MTLKDRWDQTLEKDWEILREALKIGVNFWDTSEDYGTPAYGRVAEEGKQDIDA